jgi:hypothetical protein
MPRPQFTLRALLVAILVVAAFFGGMAVQKRLDTPTVIMNAGYLGDEIIEMRDGTHWQRLAGQPRTETEP